ncbi:MAG: S-layer homology domain-containing protein [Candidatus Abawacabacteria bacterium]|nr:S-layer homology domain-containing protein [Candidatus Abawacabacteria bacterium]
MSLKKVSALIISVSLLLALIPATRAATFQDVRSNDWFYPYTYQLAAAGIIANNANFFPYRPITRAELAKMASKIAEYQRVLTLASPANTFCDVALNDWSNQYIQTLYSRGAVQGTSSGCAQRRVFHPNDFVTRAEALKILLGVYEIVVQGNGSTFNDIEADSWYAPYVSTAASMGVVNSSGSFHPHIGLTRAEMSKIIVKLSDYVFQHPDITNRVGRDPPRSLSSDDEETETTVPIASPSVRPIIDPLNPTPTPTPAPATPTLSASCRPENCIGVDWRTRARALDIPGYQRRVANDGKLILISEKFQITLPDNSPDAEEYGRILLYQLRQAYAGVRRTLGYDPYALPNSIKEEHILNYRTTGECCGLEEDGYPMIWTAGTREHYLQTIRLEGPQTGYLPNAAWDSIVGGHEITHRFNWTLNLYGFLDEGLANYVQDRGHPQSMVCRQGGYEINGQFFNYEYLYRSDSLLSIYNSGDCFWQRIEQLYGLDMIHRIESRFRRKEERDRLRTRIDENGSPWATWTSFSGQLLIDLQQAFVPEIGERFWTDFQDFCFSPTMAEGKTYANELAMSSCAETSR